MTVQPTTNQHAPEVQVLRQGGPPAAGLDLATAGRGVAAAADVSPVVEWAQTVAVVHKTIDMFLETPFVPTSYWPLPDGVKAKDFKTPWLVHPSESQESYAHRRRIAGATATLAALHGERYGWQPPQSWKALYVVSGRVGIGYEGALALVRGLGFDVEIVERSAERAALRIKRPGSQRWSEHEFTMGDAVRAGYVKGQGPNTGRDDWKGNEKYDLDPKTMLMARCVSIATRLDAPDALAGMPIAETFDDDRDAPDAVEAPARVTAAEITGADLAAAQEKHAAVEQRAAAASEQPVAPVRRELVAERVDPVSGEHVAGEPDEARANRNWRLINARFNDLGVTGPGQAARRLQVIASIVGRSVARGSELTGDEGQLVLDNLAGDAGARLVVAVLGDEDGGQRQEQAAPAEEPQVAVDPGDADPTADADWGRPAALEGEQGAAEQEPEGWR